MPSSANHSNESGLLKQKVMEIITLLQSTDFKIRGLGVSVAGKRYPQGAAAVLKELQSIQGDNFSVEKCKAIFGEINQHLGSKLKPSSGLFSARATDTADIYKHVLSIIGSKKLPLVDDTLLLVAANLGPQDQLAFSQVSSRVRTLISPIVKKPIQTAAILHAVINANIEKVEPLLKQHPELLLEKGEIQASLHHPGFKNVSPLLLALLRGDTEMYDRMLGVTRGDNNEVAHITYPQGISAEQIMAVREEYLASAEHYNHTLLREKLQEGVTNYAGWNVQQRIQYCQELGQLQRTVPIHMMPSYMASVLPPTQGYLPRSFAVLNKTGVYPLQKASGLGVHFAILGGGRIMTGLNLPIWKRLFVESNAERIDVRLDLHGYREVTSLRSDLSVFNALFARQSLDRTKLFNYVIQEVTSSNQNQHRMTP